MLLLVLTLPCIPHRGGSQLPGAEAAPWTGPRGEGQTFVNIHLSELKSTFPTPPIPHQDF